MYTDNVDDEADGIACRRTSRARRGLLAGLMLAGALVVGHPSGPSSAAEETADDGMPDQQSLDRQAGVDDYAGLWGDAPGGIAARPYVRSLVLIDGQRRTAVVTDGTVATPPPQTPGTVTMVIAPYNLCKKAGNDRGECYASPNRLGMTLGYVKQPGQLGRNFSAPTDSGGSPLDLPVEVSENTEVEVVIDMNTWGQELRWTWMNGEPAYWRIDDQGTGGATITMRFRLVGGPDRACSTAVPVMPCDTAQAAQNYGAPYAPVGWLRGDLVMSLDETGVTREFNGALFASSNADIGSLEMGSANSSASITYGIVGPPRLDGDVNTASFRAFVSDTSLVNYFGATHDVVTTSAFRDSALAVSRADGGTSSAPSWTRWSATANGTAGWFLAVDGIRFDGDAVPLSTSPADDSPRHLARSVDQRVRRVSQPARISIAPAVRVDVSARRRSGRVDLTVRARSSTCTRTACRVVVDRLTNSFSSATTRLAAVRAANSRRDVNVSTRVMLAPRQRIAVQLQARRGDRWIYVGSATIRP